MRIITSHDQAEIKKIEQAIAAAAEELSKRQPKRELGLSDLPVLRQQIEELQRRKSEAETGAEEARAQAEMKKAELEDRRKALKSLTEAFVAGGQVSGLRDRIGLAEYQADKARDELKDLHRRLDVRTKLLASYKKLIEDWRANNGEAYDRLARLEKALEVRA